MLYVFMENDNSALDWTGRSSPFRAITSGCCADFVIYGTRSKYGPAIFEYSGKNVVESVTMSSSREKRRWRRKKSKYYPTLAATLFATERVTEGIAETYRENDNDRKRRSGG